MPKPNPRVTLSKISAVLAPFRKDEDPSQPAGPSDGTLEATDATGDPASVLTDATTRLGAVLQNMQGAGGQMPDNFAQEIQSIAKGLLALIPDTQADANIGGPDAGAEPSLDKRIDTSKELDPYTEMKVTLDAACSRIYGAQDLMRQNKLEEATSELQAIGQMIQGISQAAGSAAQPEKSMKMLKVQMTPAQFLAYATDQIAVAAKEPAEKALPRMEHLSKVTKAALDAYPDQATWSDKENGKVPAPLKLELLEAYKGSNALGGGNEDLTSMQDQETDEAPQGTPKDDTGEPSKTNFSSNGIDQGGQDTMKTLGDSLSAILSDLQRNNDQTPGTPQSIDRSGATATSKGEFKWPADLASPVFDDEPAPRLKKVDARAEVKKSRIKQLEEDHWGYDGDKS